MKSVVKVHCFILISLSLLFSTNSYAEISKNCAYFSDLDRNDVLELLSDGKFSGAITESTNLTLSGCLIDVGSEVGVYFYENYFGNSRVSYRLIFISSLDGYMGMYPVPDKPIHIIGSDIYFPFDAKYGNVISILNGVFPEYAYLDGEHFSFFQ